MLKLNRIHHIAIICTDYQKSKHFYTEILGLNIVREVYREQRDSYKLDLEVAGQYQVELFSFPYPPARPSRPEALGLRHLAFEVDDIDAALKHLKGKVQISEEIVIPGWRRFSFYDPFGNRIELLQILK